MSAVYWQDGAPTVRAALVGDTTAEVAIVGGGIGGLATAWHLADRGIRSLVIEGRGVATGASGRNGGFLIAGPAPMYNDACERFGNDIARRIQAATLQAQQEVYGVAESIGASGAFRRVGMLRLAVDAAEADHVRAHHSALARDGFSGELIDEHNLPSWLRRDGRIGLVTDHDASVHPVRWLTALAAALEARGVRIVEGTRVDAVASRGNDVVLGSDHGAVTAGAAVVAADGTLARLVPRYTGRVNARRLHMVATAPLGVDHVRHPVYARYGYEYHQQLPDGRVVLGGFGDLDGADSYTHDEVASPVVVDHLERYLRDELGIDVPVTHRWVGIVGYTDDQRPYVGAVPDAPGTYAMGGYCGTGNLTAWVAGRIVADLIATGARSDGDLFDAAR